jgi:hypothetical protein
MEVLAHDLKALGLYVARSLMRDRLRTHGLFSEIISWKLRMFVPTDASGVEILAKVLEHYAIERIAEREAA